MTRLIDADALKYDFGEINDGKNKWWDLYVTNEAIAQQPTVDAVPIEWLKCKRNEHKLDGFAWIFEAVIDEWRREHAETD